MSTESETLPTTQGRQDWEATARTALAGGASKGMRKVNRRTLTDLCTKLADGIPLETAARALQIEPQSIRAWADTRPTVWRAIEQARAAGETDTIQVIKAATDWKAAAYRLGLQRPEYRVDRSTTPGGVTLNVVLNVPVPRQLGAGDSAAVIDGTAIEASPAASPASKPEQ